MVYRDGASAKETNKLHYISLHLLYTSLVSVCVITTLCTLPCYILRLVTDRTSTYLFTIITLCSTMNINLCRIVHSVLHGLLIITSM